MTEQPPNDPYGSSGGMTPPPPPGYGQPPAGDGGYGAPPGYGPPGGGFGAPPGYGGPGGYGPMPGTNQKAIWSLVCAIVGFCCGPVGVVGIILGKQAKEETARTGQSGNGLAQAGFVIGIISTVLWVLWLLYKLSA